MTTTGAEAGDLDIRWRSLSHPVGRRISTERLRQWAGGEVRVAVDADRYRHLLVAVREGTNVQVPPPVKGLMVRARRLAPDGQREGDWIDLSVDNPAWYPPFAALCSYIVKDLPTTGGGDVAALLAVLDRWRRFWSTARNGLSRQAQTGLAGELWTLLEWLPAVTPAALTAWQGPLGGRHDFVSPELSLEVKTTSTSTGPVVHPIAGLHQLDDPVTGKLLLLSLRMVLDPLGPHTLDGLVKRARAAAAAAGGACGALIEERLTAVGILPDGTAQYTDRIRVTQQDLYAISPGFPRLTPSTFPMGAPVGVIDVSYSLDTTACGQWRIHQVPKSGLLARLT